MTFAGPQPHVKHVPGYTGFVPGIQAENIYKKTYGHASHIAISGEHKRFQWREQEAKVTATWFLYNICHD